MTPSDEPQPLLLSVDFEDWHQLVRRRLGVAGWEAAGPGPRAPDRARCSSCSTRWRSERRSSCSAWRRARIPNWSSGSRGRPRDRLSRRRPPPGPRADPRGVRRRPARRARRSSALTGRRPIGYRAPAFSITREAPWAYDVLADEGFAYDASQHDSPRLRGRESRSGARTASAELSDGAPVGAPGGGLARRAGAGARRWCRRTGRCRIARAPGAAAGRSARRACISTPTSSTPSRCARRFPPELRRSGRTAPLRAAQRNLARRRAPEVLRAIAERHPLIPYGEAHAQLSGGATARS